MDRIILKAFAKVNLFLDLVSKQPDGYHEVNTVMLSHSLCDYVAIEKLEKGIELGCSDDEIPCDEHNTAYKAAAGFFRESGIHSGVKIYIEKGIPSQAGMGGGSSDAAAVIRGLNIIYGEPLDGEAEKKLASEIGADVPFFLEGGCQRLSRRGDISEETFPVPSCAQLILKPHTGISTPAAYKELDRLYSDFNSYEPKAYWGLADSLRNNSYEGIEKGIFNIFDAALPSLCPEALELLSELKTYTPASVLCGSGSAVVGIFRNLNEASLAEHKIRMKFPDVFSTVSMPTESGVLPL